MIEHAVLQVLQATCGVELAAFVLEHGHELVALFLDTAPQQHVVHDVLAHRPNEVNISAKVFHMEGIGHDVRNAYSRQ
eukprot:13998859-Alexandrium_andersonii.AAC.1